MTTMVSKVDKSVLLSIPNPRYADKIKKFSHLMGVTMDDEDTKPELPIHLILGASEYSRIKTHTKPKIGKAGEPIAELTTLGWMDHDVGRQGSGAKQCLSDQNIFSGISTAVQSRHVGPSRQTRRRSAV